MSSKLRVGYLWDSYPHKRNIINIIDEAEYKKVFDVYKLLSFIAYIPKKFKIFGAENYFTDIKFKFDDFESAPVDIFHFFNNISYGKTPWVSTFETFLPRISPLLNHQKNGIPSGNKKIEKALAAISAESCKKIIAISECTANFENELLNVYPQYRQKVKDKMIVIHPPQPLQVDNFSEKNVNINDKLSFILVGGDFFRKGGMEVLNTFDKLVNINNLPLKLTIVSTLEAFDYATNTNNGDVQRAKKIIENNKEWITYHERLPNEQVLQLMKNHMIGLLPTWADTYGYSALELQACGCPVISTDIRALPEVNNLERGWVINVPKNNYGEALYTDENSREILSRTIEEQLETIINQIHENREQIKVKATNSIDNIRINHSPVEYKKKIKKIYMDSL